MRFLLTFEIPKLCRPGIFLFLHDDVTFKLPFHSEDLYQIFINNTLIQGYCGTGI